MELIGVLAFSSLVVVGVVWTWVRTRSALTKSPSLVHPFHDPEQIRNLKQAFDYVFDCRVVTVQRPALFNCLLESIRLRLLQFSEPSLVHGFSLIAHPAVFDKLIRLTGSFRNFAGVASYAAGAVRRVGVCDSLCDGWPLRRLITVYVSDVVDPGTVFVRNDVEDNNKKHLSRIARIGVVHLG